jgi:hypothetical protein
MVPNISRNGRSFRGAGAYHLHDKPNAANARPRTSERVAFTAARNLANTDPHAALDEMWRTAEDARHLKARSGLAPTGRKNEAPVKTVSLAWAPGQSPTHEEMCVAADSFLKAMGWGEHQALYVAHNDTHHPHLHIILNRVHPDTGRALNDWQERKRAQKWAFAYEKAHGRVLCPARATHEAKARSKNTPTGLPYRQARLLTSQAAAPRQQIAKAVRAAFRPRRAMHYRRQRAALHRFDRQRRGVERIATLLARAGDTAAAIKALHDLDQCREALLRSFRLERAAIARAQHAAVRNRLAEAAPRSTARATPGQGDRNVLTRRAAPAADVEGLPGPLHRVPSSSPSSFRYAALRDDARSTAMPPSFQRRQLLALQAAAREQTRPQRSAPSEAARRARAEIAVAFAHRWASIRRLPPSERAAAAAALQAEQAAALAARMRDVLGELNQQHRTRRLQLRGYLAAERCALSIRRRVARVDLAAVVQARRRFFVSARRAGSAAPTL